MKKGTKIKYTGEDNFKNKVGIVLEDSGKKIVLVDFGCEKPTTTKVHSRGTYVLLKNVQIIS